jgi:DnaK suppressor protein
MKKESAIIPATPAFTGSLNNKSTQQNRYTDEDLEEFRQLINAELVDGLNRYELLNRTLLRYNNLKKKPVTFILKEDDTEVFTLDEISRLADSIGMYIRSLHEALERIENKTFGICKITGKLIAKECLKMAPVTTIGIDATVAGCLN